MSTRLVVRDPSAVLLRWAALRLRVVPERRDSVEHPRKQERPDKEGRRRSEARGAKEGMEARRPLALRIKPRAARATEARSVPATVTHRAMVSAPVSVSRTVRCCTFHQPGRLLPTDQSRSRCLSMVHEPPCATRSKRAFPRAALRSCSSAETTSAQPVLRLPRLTQERQSRP